MSNTRKAKPRNPQPGPPPEHIIRTAAAAQCPDCDSEVSMWRDRDGGWHVSIAHDDECPQLQWRQRAGLGSQLAVMMPDGSPLPAETVAAIAEALAGQPDTEAVIATAVQAGTPIAPGWRERDAIDRFVRDRRQ